MPLRVFVVAGRLRAGWRFLLFAIASAVCLIAVNAIVLAIPTTARLLEQAHRGTLTVAALLVLDGAGLAIVVGLTALAGRLEGRAFSAYGLPLGTTAASRFSHGARWGLAMASSTIAVMWLLGGVTFDAPTSSVLYIVSYAVAWAVAFTLVALFEELLYRGYALVALTGGLGFWPAAVLLAAMFGGLHLTNSGESAVGALNVVVYGLFASLTLRRTGNLWFAIGMHAAWDYALCFIYGVPSSGMQADIQLLHAHPRGPDWLTGGAAGAEGSVLGLAAVAVAVLLFARQLPSAPIRSR